MKARKLTPAGMARVERMRDKAALISARTIEAAKEGRRPPAATDNRADNRRAPPKSCKPAAATKPEKPADLSTGNPSDHRAASRKGGAAKRTPRPVNLAGKPESAGKDREGSESPPKPRRGRLHSSLNGIAPGAACDWSPPKISTPEPEISAGISAPVAFKRIVNPIHLPNDGTTVGGPRGEMFRAVPAHPPGTWPLLDLGLHQCRFACTPDDAQSHRFCGAPTARGAWCADHRPLVYGAGTESERGAARAAAWVAKMERDAR